MFQKNFPYPEVQIFFRQNLLQRQAGRMSDAELRKQSRYTWMLVVFTAVVMIFMLKQSRAAAEAHAEKFGGTYTAGLMIETGGNLR